MRHSQPNVLTLLVSGHTDVQSAMAAILFGSGRHYRETLRGGETRDLLRDQMLTRKRAVRIEKGEPGRDPAIPPPSYHA
jgi:hypothetical protein